MKEGITRAEFEASLDRTAPPATWPERLQALWWDASGNWAASHGIAQDLDSPAGSWIHGYLHLKEGDRWNAEYWYRRARRPVPEHSLEREFEALLNQFLAG